jgi:hypothetical protein
MDPLRLELFCLAKPYFRQDSLLIAEDEAGEIAGFLQFGPTANEDLSDVCASHLGLAALCVRPSAEEDRIAAELLHRLFEIAVLQNVSSCSFRPLLPDAAYFVSFGPADGLASAISGEIRVCRWLSQSGFTAKHATCLWELDLYAFQAPVDRMQIQIRRTAAVNQQIDEPELPWWQACILGHTEPTAFQLIHRTEKRVLSEAVFWALSPELQATISQVIWLWPPALSSDAEAEDHMLFLLAEALRQYQEERAEIVRTASHADSPSITSMFRRLGFKPSYNGMVFQKRFV